MSALTISKPGIYPGIPAELYHSSGITPTPALSSTGARILTDECPAVLRHRLDNGSAPNSAFDIGTATHTLVLEPRTFGERVVEIPFDNYRTKAAQEARDEARAAGKIPLLIDDMDLVRSMRAAVRAHPVLSKMLKDAEVETSIFWNDRTGEWMKARPDVLARKRRVVIDLKTAVTSNPHEWARRAINGGLHQQAAFYLEGLEAVGIRPEAFLFAVVSKEPPHLVTVFEFDAASLDVGRDLNRRAMDTYHRCRSTNSWDSYALPGDICTISLPKWAQDRAIDLLADAA